MRYAVIARDGTDPEAKARRLAVRPAHLERVAPFVERGRVLIGGAILGALGAYWRTRQERRVALGG